jgi:colanic acid biosynthesis protein WcaH
MLDTHAFKAVLKNTPLVSIDLCLICDGQILLGKRNNEPLKGEWFTPGGRILKNEMWQSALLRIASSELGLNAVTTDCFYLMGVWDHFYTNSAIDEEISTHYVNLPHYLKLDSKPYLKSDNQHNRLKWFELNEVAKKNSFHKYMRIYASWLIKMGFHND